MDEARHLYDQIAKRTAGSIYIGVVGPVRTGKSTFIKRFMEQLVLPHLENTYQRDRARDELPQSGSGRTIMTTEPKFVPEQAVEISPGRRVKAQGPADRLGRLSGAGRNGRRRGRNAADGHDAVGAGGNSAGAGGGDRHEKGHGGAQQHRHCHDDGRQHHGYSGG